MTSSELPLTAVHIVTYDSERYISRCLESVLCQQSFSINNNLKLIVTDNNSSDGTLAILERDFSESVDLLKNSSNTGFCAAQNSGINRALGLGAQFVLVLNPDVRLKPDCLCSLVQALASDMRAGLACPKLLRCDEDMEPLAGPVLDAAGMFITPTIRHFDRGSDALDRGQYQEPEYVFGGSGATLLLKADFIRDASFREHRLCAGSEDNDFLEVFDERFFAYREDADLAWRAQWLGWKCRYVPAAVAYHRRLVLPRKRAELSAILNRLGVQNRFLLQLNNFSVFANLHCIVPGTIRNALVLGACFTVELSSAKAVWSVLSGLGAALRRRRQLIKRRRVSSLMLASWFSSKESAESVLTAVPDAGRLRSILVIIVNYNSGPHLMACLNSVSEAVKQVVDSLDVRVIVADNASDDASCQNAETRFAAEDDIRFVQYPRNLGFAGAINSSAETESCDAILVLNPDVVLNAEAFKLLIDTLQGYPQLGAVCPVLEGEDRKPQDRYVPRTFPSLASTVAELFYVHRVWANNPWTRHLFRKDDSFFLDYESGRMGNGAEPREDLSKPFLVEQPAASCLLIRRSAFDCVSGFSEEFYPAWFEDVDFSKRLFNSGWLSAIVQQARVSHEGGYSKEGLSPSAFASYWYRNMLRYWAKHSRGCEYALVRVAFSVALLGRALVSLLRGLVLLLRRVRGIRAQMALSMTLFKLAVSPLSRMRTTLEHRNGD